MAEENSAANASNINIKYLFVMCNDVDEMRHFYTDLLRMNESKYRNEEDWGWLCYKLEGFELMFFRAHEKMGVIEEWVWQPGWGGDIDGALNWAKSLPTEGKEALQDEAKNVPVFGAD